MVVPFLQEMHGGFGDYWRFPQANDKMFTREHFNLLYISFNNHKNTSVYIFALAARDISKWNNQFNISSINLDPVIPIGSNVYKNAFYYLR